MIDLRHGDSFAGLAELEPGSVDVTLTDPPFDARTHRAAVECGDWRRGDRRVGGALPFAALSNEQIGELARELVRVTRRWMLVFCGERQIETWASAIEAAGGRFVRLGFAVRTNARPQMTGDRPAPGADPIVIAHPFTGRMRWNGRGRPARWESPAARFDPGGQLHPTQKPLSLVRALVEDFADVGELVCDPFAGVATTAVACKELGRRFLGWEIDADYHRVGVKRIEAAREQLQLKASGPAEQMAIPGLDRKPARPATAEIDLSSDTPTATQTPST